MRRIFVKGKLTDTVEITGSDAHHIIHVMRAKVKDEIVIVDEEKNIGRYEFAKFAENTVSANILEFIDESTDSPIRLTLAQCLLKGEKFDFVVQKATELGASRICPVASANCVMKLDGIKAEKRRERWQKIADEAAKQCGRTSLMNVKGVLSLEKWLEGYASEKEDEGLLFCYEGERATDIGDVLDDFLSADVKKITALIGTEGGFSAEEADLITSFGGRSVTLGRRILRAETAAVAVLSIVQYALGDMGGRKKG